MPLDGYVDLLDRKRQLDGDHGFEPQFMPEFLFGFQRALVEWATRKGRAAIFADCGLGKTPMQLVWAQNVAQKTGRPVLILTPLAVSYQTAAEATKFGVTATVSRDGRLSENIIVTNYDRLHYFDATKLGGVVCDESSAIKSFDGQRRAQVTEFMRKMRYRLLCTATAAPNDYIELGTSSEALGYLGYMDMLSRFFTNKENTMHPVGGRWRRTAVDQWRFKGHAEDAFWRWLASWGRALTKPSDLGFSDDGFLLPPLHVATEIVEARTPPEDRLFDVPALGLDEERGELRRTIEERCERVAGIVSGVDSAVAWCQLNAEADLVTRLVPDAVQVSGADSPDEKEEKLAAFSRGDVRVLVTKPVIGAWGLNWQHCAQMTFFPSHSYEQYYQAVRRSWRFGQTRPVTVNIVTTESGARALENLTRKARQAERMFHELVAHMNDAHNIDRSQHFSEPVEVPEWV